MELSLLQCVVHGAAAVLRHPLSLGVARQEDRRERATVELARRVERLLDGAVVIRLQERLAILLGAGDLAPLEHDGAPRNHGSGDQEEDHELDDPAGLPDQVQQVEARETSPHDRPSDDETHDPLVGWASRMLGEGS